jgi:peptide deformylase
LTKLPIVKIGTPVLRQRCRALPLAVLKDARFIRFLNGMVVTMHEAHGVGLAANQVGRPVRAMVLECRSNRRYPEAEDFPLEIFINLRILRYSRAKVTDWEGCLSIPGYRGKVARSKAVTFEAWTLDGRRIRKTVSGFHARVIQHEADHLNGFFYMDRMKNLKSWRCIGE